MPQGVCGGVCVGTRMRGGGGGVYSRIRILFQSNLTSELTCMATQQPIVS